MKRIVRCGLRCSQRDPVRSCSGWIRVVRLHGSVVRWYHVPHP